MNPERNYNLPEGVVLHKISCNGAGEQSAAYFAVHEKSGMLYSACPRDENGRVITSRPKGGWARSWESYRARAIAAMSRSRNNPATV